MLHWFAYAVLWIAMKFWRWVVWLAVVLAMPASYLLPAFAISWVSFRIAVWIGGGAGAFVGVGLIFVIWRIWLSFLATDVDPHMQRWHGRAKHALDRWREFEHQLGRWLLHRSSPRSR